MVAEPKILLKSVGKRYQEHDVHAVNDVSISVAAGERVALMGPSGCGKSTLLNLIGGIDRSSSGQIFLDALELGQLELGQLNDKQLTDLRRKRIGFVFQFFNLLSTLTVSENVALPLELAGNVSSAEIKQRVDEALGQVDLKDRSDFYPSQLSGGQMQRVAIARALIHRPDILLADEPTGNLDSETGRKVMALLTRLCQENHQTLLLATHSEEAARYTDRIVHMRDGRIVSIDAPVVPR